MGVGIVRVSGSGRDSAADREVQSGMGGRSAEVIQKTVNKKNQTESQAKRKAELKLIATERYELRLEIGGPQSLTPISNKLT